MRTHPLTFLVPAFLMLVPAASQADMAPIVRLSGQAVLEVEVSGDSLSAREREALLPQTVGETLQPDLVREGIVNLFRTGLYENVEVMAQVTPMGVILRYVVVPKRWLKEVDFDGNLRVSDEDLLRKVNFRRNEAVTEERLNENAEVLREYYRFRGMPDSEISYRIALDKDNRTRVVFSIWEGSGLFISDVRLEGDAGISRTKLLSMIRSMPGERLDGQTVEADLAKIREYLRKKSFLTPELKYEVKPDNSFPGGARVTFTIRRGMRFRLMVHIADQGEVKWLHKQMRKAFLASASPEKAKILMENRVLDRYRQLGFHFTSVRWGDRENGPSERVVTMDIDRGQKALIGKIQVDGVWSLTEKRLFSALGLREGRPFVKDELDEAVKNLEKTYRMEGYLSAVVSLQPLNFIEEDDHQVVDISIMADEGERTTVRKLVVEGGPVREARAIQILGISEDGPFVPEILQSGRDSLLQELGRKGYLYASVAVSEPVENGDGSVDISISVQEGPRVRLGSVIIKGNENVKPKIILLALDLHRGEILTRDKILKAQERVYRLGVMSSVDLRLADPEQPQEHKDLLLTVVERPRYVVGLKMGYGNEDRLRAEASVTHRNVGGMARSLALTGKTSHIEQSTTLLYKHPWFTSLPIDLTLSLSDVLEDRDSYSRDSLSVALDLVRAMSEKTEVRLGYSFEGLRLFNVSPDAQLSPDDEGKTDVASVIAEILYDDRDDFLDPWSGILGDLVIEYASRQLGSEAEFYKVEVAAHRYIPIGDTLVLAGLLRLGQVLSYGRSEEVIISERFFLGGQNSVRGYRLDSLGPRDADGDPVGGNYMVNANLELRYPLYRTLRGVIFSDSGSIWLDQASQSDDTEFRLRVSAGLGIRWTSPIGPLSVDYGYKLNPAEGDEDDNYRWHFSIGHAF